MRKSYLLLALIVSALLSGSLWLGGQVARAARLPASSSSAPTMQTVLGGDTPPLSVTLANGYHVTFAGVRYNTDGTSTWSYHVEELPTASDLSNWSLEIPGCTRLVTASPEPWEEVYPDPNSHLNGIKWQTGAGFSEGTFTFTLLGQWSMGTTTIATKDDRLAYAEIAGPACTEAPQMDVTKTASPTEAQAGDVVTYTIRVTNTHSEWAENVVVTDVIPLGMNYVGGSVQASFGSASFNVSKRMVHWKGTLAPRQVLTLTFMAWVREPAEAGTVITNTAEVTRRGEQPEVTEVTTLTNGYVIRFLGVRYNADGTSTWRYEVEELPSAQDLSNWSLELPPCARITDAGPEPWEAVNPDPNSHLVGIKWGTGAGFSRGTFEVTVKGHLTPGDTRVAAKGPDVRYGLIAGPACNEAPQYRVERDVVTATVAITESIAPTWTMLVYLSGDNNLDNPEHRLVRDWEAFNALERAATLNPRVPIYVQWDRSPDHVGGPDEHTRRYRVRPDLDAVHLADYTTGVDRFEVGEVNMGQPATLATFVGWAREQAGATYEALTIIGHGGGWSPTFAAGADEVSHLPAGLAWDDTSGDYLSTRELGTALRSATSDPAGPLEVLFLEASLMANLETAYELRGTAQYLVASQGAVWAGFPYERYLAGVGTTTTPRVLASKIVQGYLTALEDYPLTMASLALDLTRIDEVAEATDRLALALSDTMTVTHAAIGDAYLASQKFDSNWDLELAAPDTQVDLYDFASQLASEVPATAEDVREAAGALQVVLEELVISEQHRDGSPWLEESATWSYDGAHGLSIYLPLGEDDWLRGYYQPSEVALAEATHWDEFLHESWYEGEAPPDRALLRAMRAPMDPATRPGLYSVLRYWLLLPLVH